MNILLDYVSVEDLEINNHTTNITNNRARGVQIDETSNFSNMLTMRFFIYCSVILLGIVLNSVVIIVYLRKLKKSTYSFLFSLAVVDLFNCLFISLDIIKSADVLPKWTTRTFCYAHAYLVDTGCLISAAIVFLLTVDRFLRSKFLKQSLSPTQCLVLIWTVVGSAIIVTSPFLIIWVAKLMPLNDREMDLMCGHQHTYYHLEINYSDTGGVGFSGPRLFLLVSAAVSVILLICAFLSIAILYVKLTSQIRSKSFTRRQKVLPVTGDNEPVKFNNSEAIRGAVIIDISAENSDISNSDIEELADNDKRIHPERLDQNQNKNFRRCEDKMSSRDSIVTRRKSSIFSSRRFPSKILTPRFYCLIVVSLVIFLFYLVHFILHIVNICRFDIGPDSGIRFVLFDCLRHSYIVCFILNPIIYSFLNRGFFKNFIRLFCCHQAQKQTRNRNSADSSIIV